MSAPPSCAALAALLALSLTVAEARDGPGDGPDGHWAADPVSGCEVWNARPVPGELASWSGRCRDGRAHGEGVLVWVADGRLEGRYEGAMRTGRPHGWGTYHDRVDEGYDSYTSEFDSGRRHGRGTLLVAGGGRYDGGFEGDRPSGWGIWRRADGSRLDGEFADGRPHGAVLEELPNGDLYRGLYRDGVRDGPGILISTDGLRYEGEFESGVPSGVGRLRMLDGGSYLGEFLAGRPHGVGIYTRGGERWEGTFEAGAPRGELVHVTATGERRTVPAASLR